MPSNHYLSRMFGSTPVPTIEKHMQVVAQCAAELPAVIEALVANDQQKIRELSVVIAQYEKEADDMKREIRLHLPKTMFMPVSRADLLNIVSVQDHIANIAQDLAGILAGRPMQVPADVGTPLLAFVNKSVETAQQANTSVGELSELFESGFRGAEVKLVETMLAKLDLLEGEADELEVEVRAAVYEAESELPPIDAYFLYRIVDLIGDVGNEAQKIGARLLLLLAR